MYAPLASGRWKCLDLVRVSAKYVVGQDAVAERRISEVLEE